MTDTIETNITKTLTYILGHPISASLEAQLRPGFTFNENNINDVTLQLAMQLCLMGNDWVVSKLLASKNKLNDLYNLFNYLAAEAAKKSPEEEAENDGREKTKAQKRLIAEVKKNRAAQENELKKLKKHIHAFARLTGHDPKNSGKTHIVNLKKLLVHYNNNLAEFEKRKKLLIKYHDLEDDAKNPDLGSDFPIYQKTNYYFDKSSELYHLRQHARAEFDRLKKLLALDHSILRKFCYLETDKKTGEKKYISKQNYAAVSGIESVTDEAYRTTRKKQKSRINKFSFAISLIVGVGEGLIAATFLAATWPFLIAVLAIGIPAALCNFILLRNDSYSVIKEIWFGKSTDTPRQKTIKTIGSIFSGAAGLSYGFLSFGSALVTLGHLIFGLSVAAALATPPITLIVLAAVIAVVTAIAIATLYDFMLRKWADEGFINKLITIKDDFIDFFKPDNKHWHDLSYKEKCEHVASKTLDTVIHTVFFAGALVVAAVLTIATTLLFKHKAVTIFSNTFRLAHVAAEKASLAITIAMGALINSTFYTRSATYMINVVKSAALAILHPIETARKIAKAFAEFKMKNKYQQVESAVRANKRLFLFATVVTNSGSQGWGIGTSHAAQAGVHSTANTFTGLNLPNTTVHGLAVASGGAGSGGANTNAALGATRITTNLSYDKNAITEENIDDKKNSTNKVLCSQLSPALFKLPDNKIGNKEEEAKLRHPHGKVGFFNSKKENGDTVQMQPATAAASKK
ncbi:MAG: hypothetical protein A3E82_02285 [Gammaproteobacteria bacterium RIFCSPHIGHO2_12_FULL_38_11]|nr:MAG: hypothetical protein A3E82_02285 [Gammaproteobacteria bacterium RIFCSPHIGHO2_12_FULL_38_11]